LRGGCGLGRWACRPLDWVDHDSLSNQYAGPVSKLFSKTLEWLVIKGWRSRFNECPKKNILNVQQVPAGSLINSEPQQKKIAPCTFCACTFLKPELFAENALLRVCLGGSAYLYNQEELALDMCPDADINNINV
jgi:hypothetical protein